MVPMGLEPPEGVDNRFILILFSVNVEEFFLSKHLLFFSILHTLNAMNIHFIFPHAI